MFGSQLGFFGGPDCARCGGFTPGNPNAMGVFCTCLPALPEEPQPEYKITVLNGIEFSTNVGGIEWDHVKHVLIPFLEDFLLEGNATIVDGRVVIVPDDQLKSEMSDYAGVAYEDIPNKKYTYLDMKGQDTWSSLFSRRAQSVKVGQEKVLCTDIKDEKHCEVRIMRIS